MKRKVLAMLVCMSMVATLLSGCGNRTEPAVEASEEAVVESKSAADETQAPQSSESTEQATTEVKDDKPVYLRQSITIDGYTIEMNKTSYDEVVKHFQEQEDWVQNDQYLFDNTETGDMLYFWGTDGVVAFLKYGYTYGNDISEDDIYQVQIELPDGITCRSTPAEVVAAYGEPKRQITFENGSVWYGYDNTASHFMRIGFTGMNVEDDNMVLIELAAMNICDAEVRRHYFDEYLGWFKD